MGSLIRLVAIVSSGFVLLGFAYFATDELSRGSQNQQNALAGERVNGKFREAVDDVNDVLIGPFGNLVDGADNTWVTHGVPALLGLLLYGFCLGMLANMLPKSREHGADWRTVESA